VVAVVAVQVKLEVAVLEVILPIHFQELLALLLL
jgi:hypothetical protein